MNIKNNLYNILEVSPYATKDQIRKAFCEKIKKLHPDLTKNYDYEKKYKLEQIIEAYKILYNDATRKQYDLKINNILNKTHYIPQKRIKYSISLKEILKRQYLPKKLKRRDIISQFAHDIEIFCTKSEIQNNAHAMIQVPAKVICPLCSGYNIDCYVCNGIGRISSTVTLDIKLPHINNTSEIIVLNLNKCYYDKFTNFSMKTLRIKITIINP